MIKFSDVRSDNLIGTLLRLPLRLLPKSAVVPIMQGPGKGLKWIVESGTHGMWLGSYELDKQLLLPSLIQAGNIVLDIGAHVGFFSLIMSRLAGRKGKVLAFEPLPRNLAFLDKHIRINGLENIQVYRSAVGKENGAGKLETARNSFQGALSSAGDLEIKTVALDKLPAFTANTVRLIKIDVEGAEADVLRGGKLFFERYKPVILLATHGAEQVVQCKELLLSYGYFVRPINKNLDELNCSEWIAESKKTDAFISRK